MAIGAYIDTWLTPAGADDEGIWENFFSLRLPFSGKVWPADPSSFSPTHLEPHFAFFAIPHSAPHCALWVFRLFWACSLNSDT
jgi:hypothetical protein